MLRPPGRCLLKRLPFVQEGVGFRRLENPLVSGQAEGGRATLRSKLVVMATANKFPSPIDFLSDMVRVFAIIAVG
ncbi:hypothetical protein ES705_33461 [subsurface metagenome]